MAHSFFQHRVPDEQLEEEAVEPEAIGAAPDGTYFNYILKIILVNAIEKANSRGRSQDALFTC